MPAVEGFISPEGAEELRRLLSPQGTVQDIEAREKKLNASAEALRSQFHVRTVEDALFDFRKLTGAAKKEK